MSTPRAFISLGLLQGLRVRASRLFCKLIGLGAIGRGSVIMLPFTKVQGPQYITIGDGTFIGQGAHLSMTDSYRGHRYAPKLVIGNGVYIGHYVTISCVESIRVEDDVVMSDRVFIGDAIHDYVNPSEAIIHQQMVARGPVEICAGAFIGINAVILPGVRIGKHAVVGASCVVTSDVPDYSVVVGSPARVVRRYDQGSGQWVAVVDGTEADRR